MKAWADFPTVLNLGDVQKILSAEMSVEQHHERVKVIVRRLAVSSVDEIASLLP